MKTRVWILWSMAAAFNVLAGILYITDKRLAMGIIYIGAGALFALSAVRTYNSIKNQNTMMNEPFHSEALDQDQEFLELMAAGQKMKAIKRCREITGLGLKEASDYVYHLDSQQKK